MKSSEVAAAETLKPEDVLKKRAIELGAELVGIASVADINRYAPPGHRPDDVLVGAKSVIVVAGHVTLRGAWRSPDQRTYYHNRDFPRIHTGIAMSLAKLIETRYGYYSVGDLPPQTGFSPALSHKLCAEMAGLGTRSMAGGIILSPQIGMLSLAVCITAMPLKADGPMTEPVCPHPSCVKMWQRSGATPCLEACPECLSGELEDGRIKWMRYDRRICSTRAQTMGVGSLHRTLLQAADEPDADARKSILLGSFARGLMETIAFGRVVAQCCECLRDCPVCLDSRTLKVKTSDDGAGRE